MAGDSSDDKLALTATAASSPTSAKPAALGESLGRYRLEKELGAGGMGVVHAAFDPDLERRIALKVLSNSESVEARQRLLREARAMARLAHPNVVTVHEVGTQGGRDYIAMEIVDGGTLEGWLKAERRSERDVIAAFVAAGRGLAAAHAAGLVHRDFKPHNVLRHKDGRIAVTDFGLVVGMEGQLTSSKEISLDQTLRPEQLEVTPSALSGLTKTGSVLGTPAYMAPEQWNGKTVGPATDQFAFSVALWEALAGERPFKGETLDALSDEVRNRREALDDSKIPRRLRKALRRGLEVDPTKRWPNMDALIAAITRAQFRPAVALAVAAAAVGIVTVILFAMSRDHAGPSCDRPALDPAAVWSPEVAAELRKNNQAYGAKALDADFMKWQATRTRACKAPADVRKARLACLDGVLGRIDMAGYVGKHLRDAPNAELGQLLVDPAVCEKDRPPRLVVASSQELREVASELLRVNRTSEPVAESAAVALLARAKADPCAGAAAHVVALSAFSGPRRKSELAEAERLAQLCADDRVISDVATTAAFETLTGPVVGEEATVALKRAESLVERVSQPDLQADLSNVRALITARTDNFDESVKHAAAAMALYAERNRVRAQLIAARIWVETSELKNRAPLEDGPRLRAEWRALAVKELGENDSVVRAIDRARASDLWDSGDIAGAHALLEKLRDPVPPEKPRRVRGRVVDAKGAPVAGATVVSGRGIFGDSIAIALPGDQMQRVKTAADGTFDIPNAPEAGAIVAQHGNERSQALLVADEVTLKLAPTSRIEGKVDLHGESPSNVRVIVRDTAQPLLMSYAVAAPVRSDGTYALDGVPRGHIAVQTAVIRTTSQAIARIELEVTQPLVRDVNLEVRKSTRTVHVIVRSQVAAPVKNAQAIVLPGKHSSSNARAVNETLKNANTKMAREILGESAPKPVLARAKPGDLYATVPEVPQGEATACAIGLPEDLADEALGKKLLDSVNLEKLQVVCVPLGITDEVVVIEVPPFPRMD